MLHLLIRYISDPRFGELACDVAAVVLDIYGTVIGQSPLIDTLFVRLRKKVDQEVKFQRDLVSVRGALDMLLASSSMERERLRKANVPMV